MGSWLEDEERSAYGLGWEYRRRDMPLESMPSRLAQSNHQTTQFAAGWREYKPSQSATYHEREAAKK